LFGNTVLPIFKSWNTSFLFAIGLNWDKVLREDFKGMRAFGCQGKQRERVGMEWINQARADLYFITLIWGKKAAMYIYTTAPI